MSKDRKSPAALDGIQHGGNHYKNMAIQPAEYCHANHIPFLEGNVVKYISRHASKNGEEDVKKAMHFAQMVLEMTYGIKATITFDDEDEVKKCPQD